MSIEKADFYKNKRVCKIVSKNETKKKSSLKKLLKAFDDKWHDRELLIAIVIVFIIVGFSICFGTFVFETNDERDFSNIFSSAFGNQDNEYSGFINILFGYLIKPLYYLNGRLNWYFLVCLALSLLSFVTIAYCFLKCAGVFIGSSFSIILLSAMSYEFFVSFQFTKNAFLYSIAGCLVLLETLREKNKLSIFQIIIGTVLVLIGSFIRFKCFIVVLPVAGSYILYECLVKQNFNLKKSIKANRKYWLTTIIVLFIIFVGYAVNFIAYYLNPEWKEFKEYNAARFEVLDKGTPGYEENKDEYEKLGISKEDLEMFTNWTFADPDKFSKQTLLKMGEMKTDTGFFSQLSISPRRVLETLHEIVNYYTNYPYLMILYTVSITFYFLFSKKRDWIIIAINIGLVVGYTWYLTCMDRILNRVTFGLILSSAVFMIYNLFTTEYKKENLKENDYEDSLKFVKKIKMTKLWIRIVSLVITSSILVSVPLYIKIYEQGKNTYLRSSYEDLLEYTQNNPEILFVADRPTISRVVVESMTPLLTSAKNESSNITYLGGWFAGTPTNKLPLEKFGYTNAFRAMAKCENVYLIDSLDESIQQKLDYLRRNYNSRLELELVISFDEIKVFRFYEGDISYY